MATVNVNLRDYLSPGGKHPYQMLVPRLEAERAAGNTVYLWSVPGFFMLAGHQFEDEKAAQRPWSDGQRWYKSAQDCLKQKNGRN